MSKTQHSASECHELRWLLILRVIYGNYSYVFLYVVFIILLYQFYLLEDLLLACQKRTGNNYKNFIGSPSYQIPWISLMLMVYYLLLVKRSGLYFLQAQRSCGALKIYYITLQLFCSTFVTGFLVTPLCPWHRNMHFFSSQFHKDVIES